MAGHSKWANIKFRKMGQDAKRGKLFTKMIREITVAARQGGEDPQANPRLRTAIDKALSANMTRDTIDRAIKRGAGNQEGDNVEEIRYEGYGPGGVAVLVDCMTDNRKRTVSEVRHLFTKLDGNLGTTGSVAYLFDQKGQFLFESDVDEEKLMDVALEAGAEDIRSEEEGTFEVLTSFDNFFNVKKALEAAQLKADNAQTNWIPSTWVTIDDEELAQKLIKLTDALEDLDDVQAVYSNADIAMSILEKLE